ncbi:hypothetical protein JG687_00001287 [Phytophthora cactorum]|uniref:RxLR effector protein n=1 Tax=Phytophthora cactorum TaxID=29920 RepID=A0A329SH19_9STRA|nr:hypothetical protein Pcac1_g9935 [Phytophthora cactorum]KAG2825513.1 hypothetical protein PC111_g9366 [Phytophthora cactorum]KAG2834060.1 hypothetical protein PC112_g6217 [Phytophthora cactorum]KAG2857015.1 hypothetical protein PC113_g11057 [Phytophthora cactorum]KAG2905365.1 hypothetical protein PC114_g11556 [Phytophthora cactorum]
MRPRCLLLVVVFTLAACCCSLADADGIVIVKASATDSTGAIANSGNVKYYLRDSKKAPTKEERGITSLTQNIPFVGKLMTMVKENPALAKAKVMVSKDIRLKGALLIVKGQLKPLAIIAAVALTGGYIMYLVKG